MKNVLALLALIIATPAMAIPDVVTWAARVENDAGPFNGNLTVSFELFDVLSAGTPLWTEVVTSAIVVDGDLVHELGSVAPLDDALINRDNLFLQVTMNGDVLAPRSALRAVPYALRAENAATAEVAVRAADATKLGGLAPTAFQFRAAAGGGLALTGTEFSIAAASISTARLADGAVTATKLAPSSVSGSAIANAGISAGKLAAASVTPANLSGTRTEVLITPPGCGSVLSANGSCSTMMCGILNGAPRFFRCNGTCELAAPADCIASRGDNYGPAIGFTVFGP